MISTVPSDTSAETRADQTLHATTIALTSSAGLLITGPSGSGKSALALDLMAYGATLVADDRTILSRPDEAEVLFARCPATIMGKIEARGIGILAAETLPSCLIRGVVDLSHLEEDRLPPARQTRLLGVPIPLFYKVDAPHFAPALLQWLKGTDCA